MTVPHRARTVIASSLLAVLLALALFGPPLVDSFHASGPFADWIRGTRPVVALALGVMGLSFFVGVFGSALSALGPPLADTLLSRSMEIAGALPTVVVLVTLRTGQRLPLVVTALVLGTVRGLSTAKGLRAELLRLGREDHVLAVRALGSSEARLFRRHLLPHITGSALAEATQSAAAVVSLDSAVTFLGLGSGVSGWGDLLSQGITSGQTGLLVLPTLGVLGTVGALWMLADAFGARHRHGPRWL